jgi:nitrous oxidase accessory protein
LLADCLNDTITQNNFTGNAFSVPSNSASSSNYFFLNYWDEYKGYDLNADGIGDVPMRPVTLFSRMAEQQPHSILLWHSLVIGVINSMESLAPTVTPKHLTDKQPFIKPIAHDSN